MRLLHPRLVEKSRRRYRWERVLQGFLKIGCRIGVPVDFWIIFFYFGGSALRSYAGIAVVGRVSRCLMRKPSLSRKRFGLSTCFRKLSSLPCSILVRDGWPTHAWKKYHTANFTCLSVCVEQFHTCAEQFRVLKCGYLSSTRIKLLL